MGGLEAYVFSAEAVFFGLRGTPRARIVRPERWNTPWNGNLD